MDCDWDVYLFWFAVVLEKAMSQIEDILFAPIVPSADFWTRPSANYARFYDWKPVSERAHEWSRNSSYYQTRDSEGWMIAFADFDAWEGPGVVSGFRWNFFETMGLLDFSFVKHFWRKN
jgi:hypothetical protein